MKVMDDGPSVTIMMKGRTLAATARKLRSVKEDETSYREEESHQLAEVSSWAEGLPDNFLRCRELSHNWSPYTASINNRTRTIYRVLRCTRCKARKHQDLTPRGHVVRTHIQYAEGFLHKGKGRIVGEARDVLRLASVMRGSVVYVDDDE